MRDPGPFLVAAALLAFLGVGMRRPLTALAAAVALCVVGFVASGAEALAWLFLMLVLPILVGAVLVGQALAWVLPHRAWRVVLGLAALPLAMALALQRASLAEVPSAVAAGLPTSTNALSTLCFDGLPTRDRRELERELAILIFELPRRRDELTTVFYADAEGPGEIREQLTLRELAEESLSGFDEESRFRDSCRPGQARALERALNRR